MGRTILVHASDLALHDPLTLSAGVREGFENFGGLASMYLKSNANSAAELDVRR